MNDNNLVIVLEGQLQGVQWTNLMIFVPGVEDAYNLVAGYIARGLLLENIKIGQPDNLVEWPVELFTGQSLEQCTQSIQQEWQDILSPLPVASQRRFQRIALLRRQIRFYEPRLERTSRRVDRLQAALQAPARYHDPVLLGCHISQIESQLAIQQVLLGHLQNACQRTITSLELLEK